MDENLLNIHGFNMPLMAEFRVVTTKDQTTIKKVIFNGPATIIFWADGSKTVVKCHKGDIYSRQMGFLYACTKRICELGGFCKKSKTNKKPFDNWMDAWIKRKAEDHNGSYYTLFMKDISKLAEDCDLTNLPPIPPIEYTTNTK